MRWTAMLVLAIGCGPLVAVDGDSTDDGVTPGEDERGDDKPGTGPSPTSAPQPTTFDDDGPVDDGDVDDGWKPDVPPGTPCSAASLAGCYDGFTFATYDGNVLVIDLHDLDGDGRQELVALGEFWRAVHLGVIGGWSAAGQEPHTIENPTAVAFGDFVDDEHIDLVAIEPPWPLLWVEPGDGTVLFSPAVQVDMPGLPLHLRAADIDLDGSDEAIATLEDGLLAVVHSFDATPDADILEGPVWQNQALALGALGLGDGAYDLLVYGVSDDQVVLGMASYADALDDQWEVHPFVPASIGLTARDFDEDGAIDIATVSATDTHALLHRWQPGGPLDVSGIVDLGSTPIAAADGWFGPSALGLVVVIDGVPTIADFAEETATPLVGPPIQGPVLVVDANSDGMDDIVARSSDATSVVVYLSHE